MACKTGKPCGDSCIAIGETCHQDRESWSIGGYEVAGVMLALLIGLLMAVNWPKPPPAHTPRRSRGR